ncbi:MAG: glycosyltransferase [Deltaproteobacteria bacterium]|nr:glycosyltransferase [Deltaproteobacteria bacterium]
MDAYSADPAGKPPLKWMEALHSTVLADTALPRVRESFPSESSYEAWLSSHGLPGAGTRRLLVTREHADFGYSGGIGTYCAELCGLLGSEAPAVAYLGRDNRNPGLFPSGKFLQKHRWITPAVFLPEPVFTALPQEELALYLVLAATALYPGLETVEVQDCDGVGARIIQAKEAGILPEALEIEITAHGTQVYVENASGIPKGDCDHLRRMALEKTALERADRVIFPTRFLQDLYAKKGCRIAPEKSRILRYPFTLPGNPPDFSTRPFSTLVFYGRTDRMKGFDIFAIALLLLPPEILEKIGEIIILGKADPHMSFENRALAEIGRRVKITRQDLSRKAAVALLSRLGPECLVICPYRADNHPNCVMEAQFCGCGLLASNTGGIPELVPEKFHSDILFRPDPESLARATERAVSRSPERTAQIAEGVFNESRKVQERVNMAHLERVGHIGPKKPITGAAGKNSPDGRFRPNLALVVSGGEGPATEDKAGFGDGPPPLVLHLKKDNSAEIRSALAAHEPDFAAFASHDAAFQPGFLTALSGFLEKNPGFDAVTGHFLLDGGPEAGRVLRPLGEGLVYSIGDNFDPYRGGMIRFSAWKELAGAPLTFSGCVRSILCSGRPVGVIPKKVASLQDDPPPFSGLSGAALPGMSLFESHRMAAALTQFRQIQESPAWTVAAEVAHNPRLLALGRLFFRILGAVFRLREKISGP